MWGDNMVQLLGESMYKDSSTSDLCIACMGHDVA